MVEFTPEPEIEIVLDEEEEELAEILTEESQALALDSELDEAIDIGRLVFDTLESLSDSQQIILGDNRPPGNYWASYCRTTSISRKKMCGCESGW